MDYKIIDVHRHLMPDYTLFVPGPLKKLCEWKTGFKKDTLNAVTKLKGISSIIYHDLMDPETQVKSQEESGVTISILSFSMFLETICDSIFFKSENNITSKLNDLMAEFKFNYPGKFEFMAIVNPFNKGSIRECERCFNELGAKGISINSSHRGIYLDSRELDYFWEYAQDKDQPIFIHPPQIPIGYKKMKLYKLEEMIGRPFDYSLTFARMIYSGIFDRYPNLKIHIPHTGGGFLNLTSRLDFGYRLGYKGLPENEIPLCNNKPSYYYRQNFYADTMGFSESGIKHAIDVFGIDKILFGTDYAAVPISQKEHIDLIDSMNLTDEEKQKIFWKNAKKLYKL